MAEPRDRIGASTIARRRPPRPRSVLRPGVVLAAAVAVFSLGGTGCGGAGSAADSTDSPAPAASEFPSASGKTLSQILRSSRATRSNLVVAATAAVYEKGENRFGFGIFTVSRQQVSDAKVAIYAAPSGGGKAIGPFPARIESLAVKPQFESQTTALDPQSAKVVYVTNMNLDRDGNWDLVADVPRRQRVHRQPHSDDQGRWVQGHPRRGSAAAAIHTPTVADVARCLGRHVDARLTA